MCSRLELILSVMNRSVPLSSPDPTETLFAGRDFDDGRTDLAWCLHKPHGSWVIRAFGYGLRKVLRRTTSRVSFDASSFERALTQIPDSHLCVLAPTHRSYFDFLLLSYLIFERPELGIGLPHIAAAEEFSRIPVVSSILRQAGAFFVKRGQGRKCEELTRELHRVVRAEESLLFFIEGKRSRDRVQLPPKRGLLRGLQATGQPISVLPIGISYERLPEELSLERELLRGEKNKMTLGALFAWLTRAFKNRIALGRIHFQAGPPLDLLEDTDVPLLAERISDAQVRATTITDYHLRVFLQEHHELGLELSWLRAQVERRGRRVLSSDLPLPGEISPFLSRTLMNQWSPVFLSCGLEEPPASRISTLDPRLTRLLSVLQTKTHEPELERRKSA